MLRFLVRRTVFGVVVMWLVATVVFAMYFIAPHNVARTLAGRQASAATVAAISHNLGLDRPVIVQYGSFLWRALHGNLGYSYTNSEPVTTLIGQSLPVTASLVAGGALIWLVLGVSTGVLAATRPRSVVNRATTGFALLFYSMPTFLLGEFLLLVLFFRLHLLGIDWFPGSGYVPFSQNPLQWARYLILPWLTIALVTAATYVRLTRGSMLDVLGEDYIRTARAKGIRESRVIYRHGLRAALTPVLTAVRDRRRHAARRGHRHRECLRPARSRGTGDQLADQAGPAHDHRPGPGGLGLRGRRQHRCQLPLLPARRADPADLTSPGTATAQPAPIGRNATGMDLQLTGLRALVTGGTRGIGRAIVGMLLDEGAAVAFCARSQAAVFATESELAGPGRTAVGSAADVADGAALAGWVAASAAALGGIDILVANVSAMVTADTEANWASCFGTDLMGTVRMVEAALPYLEQSNAASIVTISSVSGREIDFFEGPYGSIKAALTHYTQGLAHRLAPRGIRANTVSPGNTLFEGGGWDDAQRNRPEMFKAALALIPGRPHGYGAGDGAAVAFLASPVSGFTSGTNLVVDGALTRGVQL